MSKYIHINLNQTVSRAQLAEIKEERKKWGVFSLIFVIFLGLGYWFYSLNLDIDNLIANRENTIADIKSKTNALKKEGQINLSKKDIVSLFKLEESRVFWAEKLMALTEFTPEDMAITELDYGKNRLTISAIARLEPEQKEFTVIDKFIALLEADPYFNEDFKSIKFKSSERDRANSQEILSFKIEAYLK